MGAGGRTDLKVLKAKGRTQVVVGKGRKDLEARVQRTSLLESLGAPGVGIAGPRVPRHLQGQGATWSPHGVSLGCDTVRSGDVCAPCFLQGREAGRP